MEDEKYAYYEDVATRANITKYSKGKGNCGYGMRKEKTWRENIAMNGEVKTYPMDKPVTWKEFKTWPDDIRREYLEGLQDKFGAGVIPIGGMMGVSGQSVNVERKRLGVKKAPGGHTPPEKVKAWHDFILNAIPKTTPTPEQKTPEKCEEKLETPLKKCEEVEAKEHEAVAIESGTLTLTGTEAAVAETIFRMIGDKKKITATVNF